MLNPMYVQLIQNQKEQELEALIEMKQRCLEGYVCRTPVIPWHARMAKFFSRSRSPRVVPCSCKAS